MIASYCFFPRLWDFLSRAVPANRGLPALSTYFLHKEISDLVAFFWCLGLRFPWRRGRWWRQIAGRLLKSMVGFEVFAPKCFMQK